MAKTDATTAPVRKSADERLASALKGFGAVVPASVSEAEKQREVATVGVQNAFAQLATLLDPAQFEETPEVREAVAKGFSSLKRSQTSILKAIKGTSDAGAAKLPGVAVEADVEVEATEGE